MPKKIVLRFSKETVDDLLWNEYRKKETILATKILIPFEVEGDNRLHQGNSGDYLVLDRGRLRVMDTQVFHDKYEGIEE